MKVPFELVEQLLARARRGESVSSDVQRLPSGVQSDVRAMLEGERLLARCPASGSTSIGSYRLMEALGQGGQGTVYRARPLDRLDDGPVADVALKVIEGISVLSSERRRRFDREVEIAASLDLPGVCPVLDHGIDGGALWIAMPLYRAGTLADWLAEERDAATRSSDIALDWICDVARTVEAAHGRGVVHRDLKPGNLALDDERRLIVLDFGLASMLESDESKLTRTGRPIGTPEYLAPERIEGGSRGDVASEVWSLGVIAYQLIARELPFRGETREALYRSILTDELERPATWDRSLPAAVWRVISAALEKHPAARYRSAAAFAEDLERARSGRRVKIAPIPWTAQARRVLVRHRVAASALAAVFLALCAALITALAFLEEAREKERRATAAEQAERAARQREEGLRFLVEARQRATSDPARALELALEAADRVDHAEVSACALEILFSLRETWRHPAELTTSCSSSDRSGSVFTIGGVDGVLLLDRGASRPKRLSAEPVTALTLSHDARSLFVGRDSGAIAVLGTERGDVLVRRQVHERAVSALVLAPDQSELFAVSGDGGAVALVKADSLEAIGGSVTFDVAIRAARWFRSPSGQRLCACLLADGRVALVDSRGEIWREWQSEIEGAEAFDVSIARQLVAIVDPAGGVRFFSAADGRQLDQYSTPRLLARRVRFDPRGDLIALATQEGPVSIRSVRGGLIHDTLSGGRRLAQLHWRRDSTGLATVTPDGEVRTWQVGSSAAAHVLTARGGLSSAQFHGDRLLACADGSPVVFAGVSLQRSEVLAGHPVGARELSVFSSTDEVWTMDRLGAVRRFSADLTRSDVVFAMSDVGSESRVDFALSPCATRLMLTATTGRAELFDVETGVSAGRLHGLAPVDRRQPSLVGFVGGAASLVATASPDPAAPAVCFWNLETGEEVARWHFELPLAQIAADGRDRCALVVDRGGVAWRVSAAAPPERVSLSDSEITRVAVSRPTARAALVDRDGTISVTSWPEMEVVASEPSPPGRLTALTFSPDGSLIALGSSSGRVTLRRSFDGMLQVEHRRHLTPIISIAFDQDSRRVATVDEQGEVHVWPTDPVRFAREGSVVR